MHLNVSENMNLNLSREKSFPHAITFHKYKGIKLDNCPNTGRYNEFTDVLK